MSRIGKKPVALPSGVKVAISGRDLSVESSKGKLQITLRPEVTVKVDDDAKVVTVEAGGDRISKAMHGLTRALIANMVTGVTDGFSKELEINGVGWTAAVQGKTVQLKVGYADTRVVDIPDGVAVAVKQNKISVSGSDKQKVGQTAAEIRSHRPPEPYNGKGIKYADEIIVRKQGKAFAGGGA